MGMLANKQLKSDVPRTARARSRTLELSFTAECVEKVGMVNFDIFSIVENHLFTSH
jgi:hypothetical protein